MTISPYLDYPEDEWPAITRDLVENFPLSQEEIVKTVLDAWDDFYSSSFGNGNLTIGTDIFLPAQATGVILEKLIASILENKYPDTWKGGYEKTHKDIINLKDDQFSFEIKTSSSPSGLYGNRSTGYRSDNSRKRRTGYYLVINYLLPKEEDTNKKVRKIRFGWIDDDDWVGQKQASGQQASIGAHLAKLKLITLFQA